MNYPPFYSGERVAYVGEPPYPLLLQKDSIHIIKDLLMLPCGCWLVDIGERIVREPNTRYSVSCDSHPKIVENDNIISWWKATSFVSLQSFQAIEFSKVVEQELVSVN